MTALLITIAKAYYMYKYKLALLVYRESGVLLQFQRSQEISSELRVPVISGKNRCRGQVI
jgi:hypothetical protein